MLHDVDGSIEIEYSIIYRQCDDDDDDDGDDDDDEMSVSVADPGGQG